MNLHACVCVCVCVCMCICVRERQKEKERDLNRINTFLFLLLGNICYNIIHIVWHNVALFTLRTNRHTVISVDQHYGRCTISNAKTQFMRKYSLRVIFCACVLLSRVPVSCSHRCLQMPLKVCQQFILYGSQLELWKIQSNVFHHHQNYKQKLCISVKMDIITLFVTIKVYFFSFCLSTATSQTELSCLPLCISTQPDIVLHILTSEMQSCNTDLRRGTPCGW